MLYLPPTVLYLTASSQMINCGKLARMLAEGWRDDLCDPVTVQRRPDGLYAVRDGHHRVLLSRLVRAPDAMLPCELATG